MNRYRIYVIDESIVISCLSYATSSTTKKSTIELCLKICDEQFYVNKSQFMIIQYRNEYWELIDWMDIGKYQYMLTLVEVPESNLDQIKPTKFLTESLIEEDPSCINGINIIIIE